MSRRITRQAAAILRLYPGLEVEAEYSPQPITATADDEPELGPEPEPDPDARSEPVVADANSRGELPTNVSITINHSIETKL